MKNKLFFNENDIPFYMICKNFINKIFMKGNKKEVIDENNVNEESKILVKLIFMKKKK